MTRPTHADELQVDLDAAQAALERHLGSLKRAVTDLVVERIAQKKAALERAVTEQAVRVVKLVRRPFAWLEAHAVTLAIGALAAGAVIGFGYYRARCASSARLAT